jgi:hypothetical protein
MNSKKKRVGKDDEREAKQFFHIHKKTKFLGYEIFIPVLSLCYGVDKAFRVIISLKGSKINSFS